MIRAFFLALVWCLLFGSFSVGNVLAGLAIGAALVALLRKRGVMEAPTVRFRPLAIARLALAFTRELLVSNLLVVWAVLRGHKPETAIVAVPLDARTDEEIALFGTLVTLTPGSLSMHVDPSRETLYVHLLLPPQNLDQAVRSLKQGLERRVLEALR